MMERAGGGKEGRASSLSCHRRTGTKLGYGTVWQERDKECGEVLCSVCLPDQAAAA